MKKRIVHILIIVAGLAAILTVVSFAAGSGRGQSQDSKNRSLAKPASLNKEPSNSTPDPPSVFSAAAARNSTLRNEVNWTFGGKQQRGWYLYDLLIGKTLSTQQDSDGDDFAAAVASWQKKRRLSPTGVLDEQSFMAMVSQWQSDRLKNRAYAEPNQLTIAPPLDFYDPSRAPELRQVERDTYAAYKKMVAAAMEDPTLNIKPSDKYFKIISAFRSREYQDQLRRKSPNAGAPDLRLTTVRTLPVALWIFMLAVIRLTRRIRIARSRLTLPPTNGSCAMPGVSAFALTSTSRGTGNM